MTRKKYLLVMILLATAIAYMIFFVHPDSMPIIVALLMLLTGATFVILNLVAGLRPALIASCALFAFGLLQSMQILDIINVIIVSAVLITLALLLYQK